MVRDPADSLGKHVPGVKREAPTAHLHSGGERGHPRGNFLHRIKGSANLTGLICVPAQRRTRGRSVLGSFARSSVARHDASKAGGKPVESERSAIDGAGFARIAASGFAADAGKTAFGCSHTTRFSGCALRDTARFLRARGRNEAARTQAASGRHPARRVLMWQMTS